MTKRLIAVLLAFVMILSSVSVMAFAADSSDKMSIGIQMLRNENGNWVDAGDYVTAGEDIKVRVTIGTDFYCGGGELLFFYSTDFFTDSYGANSDLAINSYYAGAPWYFYGSSVRGASATGNLKSRLLNNWGSITQAEYDEYSLIFAELSGPNTTNEKFSADEWLCEFDLHVIDTLTSGTGDFLVIPGTVASTSNLQGRFDLTKGERGESTTNNMSMFDRDTTVTYLDSGIDSVEILADPVTLTFDAGLGSFANGSVYSFYGPENGSFKGVDEPTRSGYTFGGWSLDSDPDTAVGGSAPAKFSDADQTYYAVWNAASSSKNTLVITTKFFREEDGEWVETSKAKRGDDLKVRVYLATDYGTDSGELVFFYDNDFFEDSYPGVINDVEFNETNTSGTPYLHNVDGAFVTSASASTKVADMVANGLISQKFANDNNYFAVAFSFGSDVPACNTDYLLDDAVGGVDSVVDDDYWFMEFDLTVKEGATDLGKLFTVAGTERAPGRSTGVIDVPKIEDSASVGGTDRTYSMMYWAADIKRFEYPVELTSTVTFDANTGAFADTTTEYVIDDYIGTPINTVAVPVPEKSGASFIGWYDASIDHEATRADVVDIPSEIPYDDVTYKALWIDDVVVSFETFGGTEIESITVTPGDTFADVAAPEKYGYTFLGWSTVTTGTNGGSDGNALSDLALPATYPSASTTYYAIWDTGSVRINYYVTSDASTRKVADRTAEFGQGIPTEGIWPVPAGYELDGWYYDIVCSAANKVQAGDVSETLTLDLYAKLSKGTFDAIFDAAGGKFADGTASKTIPTEYLADVKAPADPARDGYEFKGWIPDSMNMDEAGKTFTATWEALPYNFTFICDGEERLNTDLTVEDDMEVPADEYKDGYVFLGWHQDPDADSGEDIPAKAPAESRTYYAIFAPQAIYTVKWDANTGYFDEDASGDQNEGDVLFKTTDNVEMDSVVAFTGTAPVKAGYTLLGWSEDKDAIVPDDELVMDCADEVEEGINKVFYAVWALETEDKGYYLYIYEMGEDGNYPNTASSILKFIDGKAGETRKVYYSAPECFSIDTTCGDLDDTNSYYEGVIPATGTLILKAYLKRNAFPVTVDYTGAPESEMAADVDTTAAAGSSYVIAAPEIDGYTKAVTVNGEASTATSVTVDKALAIVVTYTPEEYSYDVTYKNAPDTVTVTDIVDGTKNYGDEYVIDVPEAEGYTATVKVNGTETDVYSGTVTEDIEAVVEYTKNSYNVNITYVIAEGTAAAPAAVDEDVEYGESYEYVSPAVTGYTPDVEKVAGTMGTDDVGVTVTYALNEYTVTVDYSGAPADKQHEDVTATVKHGEDFTVSVPAIDGYTPVVKVDGVETEDTTVAITDETAITVEYVKNKYNVSITYVIAEGTATAPAAVDEDVEYGESYEYVSPAVTGYTPDVEKVAGTMGTDDVDVTVTYTPVKYTFKVTYSGAPAAKLPANVSEQIAYGETYTVVADDIAGYEKVVTVNGEETAVLTGEVEGDVTATVVYTAKSVYTVTWDANEGFWDTDDDKTYTEGTDYKTDTTDNVEMDSVVAAPAEEPYRTGYTFLGWSADKDAVLPDSELVMDSAEGKTLYAVWSENTTGAKTYYLYIYEMDVNGEYPAEPTSKVTYNDGIAGTEKKVSYTPATGFTLDNGEGKTVLQGTIPENGNLILKAYLAREANTFKAVYSDGDVSSTVYYGDVIAEPAERTVTGYNFLGWSDTECALGEGTANYEFPVIMGTEDITVYAVYEKASYTVTFNAGDGVFEDTGLSTETTSVEYKGTISEPANPKREGYAFEGWATADEPDTPITTWNETMDAAPVEYVAVWSKNAFIVDFKVPERDSTSEYGSGYGTLTADLADYVAYGAQQTVAYQGTPDAPDAPEIEYYVFKGWSTDGVNAFDTLPEITEDTTFYAVFEAEKIYLIAREGSTTVIDRGAGKYGDMDAYDYVTRTRTVTSEPASAAAAGDIWYVYGLETAITVDRVKNVFCDVHGDGRMEFESACTSSIPGIEPGIGTATKLTVVSNVTNEVVETFYLVVFGDIDGDGIITGDDTSILKAEVAWVTEWSSFDTNGTTDTARFMAGDIDDTNTGKITGEDVTAEKALVARYMIIDQATAEMEYY